MGIWMCYSGSASCDEDKASFFSVLQPVVAARKRKLSIEAATKWKLPVAAATYSEKLQTNIQKLKEKIKNID